MCRKCELLGWKLFHRDKNRRPRRKEEGLIRRENSEGNMLRPFTGVGICYQKMTAHLLNSASYLPNFSAFRHVLCPYTAAAVSL